MRFVVVGVFFVVVACGSGRRAPDVCAVERGVQTQPLVVRTAHVDYVLDVDAGGPLLCTPGPGTCEACVGGIVTLPRDEQTTLAIGVRNSGQRPFRFLAGLPQDADPAFEVLAPLPGIVDAHSDAEVFVGVTPTSTDEIEATVFMSADADNQGRDAFEVTLRVAGAP